MKQNLLASVIKSAYKHVQVSRQYIKFILLRIFTDYGLRLLEEAPTDGNRATSEFYGNKPYANNKT